MIFGSDVRAISRQQAACGLLGVGLSPCDEGFPDTATRRFSISRTGLFSPPRRPRSPGDLRGLSLVVGLATQLARAPSRRFSMELSESLRPVRYWILPSGEYWHVDWRRIVVQDKRDWGISYPAQWTSAWQLVASIPAHVTSVRSPFSIPPYSS